MLLPNIDLASGRTAYEQQDVAPFAVVAAALGVDLTLATLTALVKPFHPSYRSAIVETVLKQIYAAVLDPSGFGFEQWAQRVTCLVVRSADRLVIGLLQSYPRKPFPWEAGWGIKRWYKDPTRNIATAQRWAAEPARTQDTVTVTITAVPHAAPTTRAAQGSDLLAAVIANPADDTARLVYADWLLEHDDVRGELIQLQCELDAASVRDPRRVAMRARERILLRDHRAAIIRDFTGIADKVVIERGLVEHITIRATALATHGAALFANHPIRRLRIIADNPMVLARLGALDFLARVHVLEIEGRTLPKAPSPCAVKPSTLLGSPLFTGLEHLAFHDVIDDDAEWERLYSGALQLQSLEVGYAIGAGAREVLTYPTTLPGLRQLRLVDVYGNDPDQVAEFAARLAVRPNLTSLELALQALNWNAVSRDQLVSEVMAAATTLTGLALEDYTAGSDRSLEAIARSPVAAQLQRVSLKRNHTTNRGLAGLIRSLPSLRELVIEPLDTGYQPADLDMLVGAFVTSPTLKQVRWDGNKLGPIRTQRALARLDLVEADLQTGRLWLSSGAG